MEKKNREEQKHKTYVGWTLRRQGVANYPRTNSNNITQHKLITIASRIKYLKRKQKYQENLRRDNTSDFIFRPEICQTPPRTEQTHSKSIKPIR